MALPKKLDPQFAKQLRSMFSKMNISEKRITIDLEKEIIEVEEEYPAQEILDSIGILTAERGRELQEEVRKMREEDWD